ncbi:MAG: hypothetical protein JW909_13715 [Planctomycetes bacterium]|nr:hypothetical protein [Planctomycetota bacterium]
MKLFSMLVTSAALLPVGCTPHDCSCTVELDGVRRRPASFTQGSLVIPRSHEPGADTVVKWLDGHDVVRWQGRVPPVGAGTDSRLVVPVREPVTENNFLVVRDDRYHFTAEPVPSTNFPLFLADAGRDPRLDPLVKSGLVSLLTGVHESEPVLKSFLDGFAGIRDPLRAIDAWVLGGDTVRDDDADLLFEMASGLLQLRAVLRPEERSVAISVSDAALAEKILRSVVLEAGVWPRSGDARPRVLITDTVTSAEPGDSTGIRIVIEGEKDVPRLLDRLRELFPPQVEVTDERGRSIRALVHSFRAGSGRVLMIHPADPVPAVISIRSETPAFWCDIRRGVVLGFGRNTQLPGRLRKPFLVSVLPYSISRMDASIERRIPGGAFIKLTVVADKPVTAPHLVALHAEDSEGRVLPGSVRLLRLRRGSLARWYQWGIHEGRPPASLVFRDILTGYRTELSIEDAP